MNMKDVKSMGTGELRLALAERIEAAEIDGEATIIRNAKRGRPRAALIPYKWLEELYELRAKASATSKDA